MPPSWPLVSPLITFTNRVSATSTAMARSTLVIRGYDGKYINGNPTKPAPFMFLENSTGE